MSGGFLREKVLPRAVATFGPALLRAIGRTWSFERLGLDPFVARQQGTPGRYVIALWHSALLPLAYLHRDENATVLVSRHRDGELIARALRGLGYRLARGSSTRGGAAALRELLRESEAHPGDLALTPDGPKGPPQKAKPGVAYVAAMTGFPILPLALVCNREWRLRSWDRFQIPKPGARIVVLAGDPIAVPEDLGDAEVPAILERFDAAMEDLERRARARLAAEG